MAIIKQLKKERQIVIVFTFTTLKEPSKSKICFNACLQITFQFPFVFKEPNIAFHFNNHHGMIALKLRKAFSG